MKTKPTLLALALASAFVPPAGAVDRYWACGSDWWDVLCWASVPGGNAVRLQPHDGDNAWLVQSDTISRIIGYRNTELPSAVLGNLVINAMGAGSITLNQNRDALNTQFTYIGTSGTGNVVQTAGTNSVLQKLSLGYLAGGSGSYQLSDSGTLSAPLEYIGDVGTGSFTQHGGTHLVGQQLTLGNVSGSDGRYAMNAGSLLTDRLVVGRLGRGHFAQNGGAVNSPILLVAEGEGSSGRFELQAGTLRSLPASPFEPGLINIGAWGVGTFNQTGGTLDFDFLELGGSRFLGAPFGSGAGNFALSDQGIFRGFTVIVGSTGRGNFNQFGGAVTLQPINNGGNLIIGDLGVGSYTLAGAGTLDVGHVQIGLRSAGTFTQWGGTHTATNMSMGSDNSSSGVYTLNNGRLAVGRIYNGSGQSTFHFNGGTLALDQAGVIDVDEFMLGSTTGSTPQFTMSDGQQLLSGTTHVGGLGNATFVQLGGSHASAASLRLGLAAGSSGRYELGGASTLTASEQVVGLAGTGNFVHTGGSNIATNAFRIAGNSGSFGVYQLSGGLVESPDLLVGDGGDGHMVQSGGQAWIGNAHVVGNLAGSKGSFTQAGGSFSAGLETVGKFGRGSVLIQGGTHSLTGDLQLGAGDSSSGRYEIINTGALTASNQLVGMAGTGTFIQSGGTNLATGSIRIADQPGGTGSYDLSGSGFLETPYLFVGYGSEGVMLQSGGEARVSRSQVLGYFAGARGSFVQTGGSFSADSETVGLFGSGSLLLRGGAHAIANDLRLAAQAGSTGSLILEGGTLEVGRIERGAGNSSILWSSGTLKLTRSDLVVGSGGLFGSDLVLGAGKTLFAPNEFVLPGATVLQNGGNNWAAGSVAVAGSYTLASGVLDVGGSLDISGSFVLAGGVMGGAGTVNNSGSFSGHGRIGGTLNVVNDGAMRVSGGVLQLANIGGSVLNRGTLDFAARTDRLTLEPEVTLDNAGLITVAGQRIEGGVLRNAAAGAVSGHGVISSAWFNNGLVFVQGGALVADKGLTNLAGGVVQLAGGVAQLTGSSLINEGTVQGTGTLNLPFFNQGTIEPVGGTLIVRGSDHFNYGMLAATSGNKLLFAEGLTANRGLISLAGGTFDNGGQPLQNREGASIVGYGVLRTGGLDNVGEVVFSGGTTTVNGTVENNGEMTVEWTPAVFTHAVVNNGTFKLTGTHVTFAGGYTENGAYISDPATTQVTTLTVNTTGYLVGGVGDVWRVSQAFVNHSDQSQAWDTDASALVFNGRGTAQFHLAGADLGATQAGKVDNFSFAELTISPGVTLELLDGNAANAATALYAGVVRGAAIQGGTVGNVVGHGFNIYYDANLDANAYLGGLSYTLVDGGQLLAAVPEPGTYLLMVGGLLLLAHRLRLRTRSAT